MSTHPHPPFRKPRQAGMVLLAMGILAGCRNDPAPSVQDGLPPEWSAEAPDGDSARPVRSGEDFEFDSLPEASKPRLPPGLRDFQQVFADAAERAIPAVVSIHSERNVAMGQAPSPDELLDNAPFQYFFGEPDPKTPGTRRRTETGLGSGVIISPSGYILTNNHVIENADVIKVRLHDESEYVGEVVGKDKPTDMAVLKITTPAGKLPTLPLGNSEKLRIGEWVIAVGNPYGLSHTVTTGIISAKGRKNTGITSYENFIQTDAAINPGNSGGALMNLSGELIGINTAIFSRSGGYQGIGFAIPIDMARKITQDLIRDGVVTRGWLGVSIQPIEKELAEMLKLRDPADGKAIRGALVGGVVSGSPAEKSGIKRGDVITKVGDLEIKDANDLLNRIALLLPNQTVDIRVIRDGITLAFKTRIARRDENRLALAQGEGEDPSSAAYAGLKVAAPTPELSKRFGQEENLEQGVFVVAVEANSRAARGKIRVGDVIFEINRAPVRSVAGFRAAMSQAGKGNKILLLVNRKGKTLYLGL